MHSLSSTLLLANAAALVAAAPSTSSEPQRPPFNQSQSIPQLLIDNPDLFYYPNLTAQPGVSTQNLPPSNQSDVEPTKGNWLGTSLFGYTECAKRGLPKAKIDDAYYDMYYLTNTDGISEDIDWNSAAAVELLGAPANNQEQQAAIQKYLYLASETTYSYTSPWRHYIHVRCDDPENRCSTCDLNGKPVPTDAIAYASDNDGKGYSQINFCPRFFDMRRLQSAAIDYGKSLPNPRNYDLRNYDNTARVFLHELMHLDYFMGTTYVNHITDLSVAYYGDPTPQVANGPLLTKLLARYENPNDQTYKAGYYVRQNADNMAWFAMAKYVQGKLGNVYPHLPLVLGRPDGPPWKEINGNNGLIFAGNNSNPSIVALPPLTNSTAVNTTGTSRCSSDVTWARSFPLITLTGMAADSVYPSDYITLLDGWAKDLGVYVP